MLVVDITSSSVISTVPLDRQPGEVAVDLSTHQVWITNYNDASVTILDREGKQIATVGVGPQPAGVAVDGQLHRAYVVSQADKTVAVIDTQTHKVVRTEQKSPAFGAATIDLNQHIVCFADLTLSLNWCFDNSLKSAGYLYPTGTSIAVDSVTHSSFAIHSPGAGLSVRDAVTKQSSTVPVGPSSTGVTVDSTTHVVYVADHDSKRVVIVKPL